MGSGKSTIGRKLAAVNSWEFIDLDNYIEEAERMAIAGIFSKKGEIYFRKKESQYLKEVLQKKENIVLATGGGTPCYGDNLKTILKTTNWSFYLKLSVSFLVERLSSEKEQRPLIKNVSTADLPEFIGKHLFERSFFYNQSKHIISCDAKKPEEIVAEIEKKLI